MSQNINLRDGEIAVVIGDASVIMNVNTAFEVFAKLFSSGCNKKDSKDTHDGGVNSNEIVDLYNEFKAAEEQVVQQANKNLNPFANVPEVKSSTGGFNGKVPVLAFAFDTKKAARYNDLRKGVGRFLMQFDSMSDADKYFAVADGTASHVVNTWLPYVNYTGPMNPMSGDEKNYIFSSKYNGKNLRWNFTPFFDDEHVGRVVLFREDALPKFILDRDQRAKNYHAKKN